MLKEKNSDVKRSTGGVRMSLEYKIISSRKIDDDEIEHTVYGIEVYKRTKDKSVLIKSLPDIYTDIKFANLLVGYCEFAHVHPDKIEDVIENLI